MPQVEDPALLVDVGNIGADFFLQQEVHATFDKRTLIFQAVLQKKGDKLTIVTLAPDGSRAYLIEQVGKKVHSEKFVSRELPFSPWHILLDVHRCYFGQPAGGPDVYEDAANGGGLTERVVKRGPGGEKPGETIARIAYSGDSDQVLQRRVVYDNVQFGYRLEIRPMNFRLLSSGSGADSGSGSGNDSY
jgi:hypothetical protein